MHSFIVASNLGIVRTGLQQSVREHIGNSQFTEAESIGELMEKLWEGKFDMILADFSYIHTDEEDMKWAAALKKQLPFIPLVIFLGEKAGNTVVHLVSELLVYLGRGAGVGDLKEGIDLLLKKNSEAPKNMGADSLSFH